MNLAKVTNIHAKLKKEKNGQQTDKQTNKQTHRVIETYEKENEIKQGTVHFSLTYLQEYDNDPRVTTRNMEKEGKQEKKIFISSLVH